MILTNLCLILKLLKMKNLENYGVLEMDTREIRETEGGGRFAELIGWCYGTIARYHYRGGVHSQYGV